MAGLKNGSQSHFELRKKFACGNKVIIKNVDLLIHYSTLRVKCIFPIPPFSISKELCNFAF